MSVQSSSTRQILHVDMDAFYASVEQRDDPTLVGKPVVIGGPSLRSVVCTASYEARPFGVRSAMPMAEALRRCPDAVVIPPRMSHYSETSAEIMAVLRRYSPLVEALSLDEAFVDVTASQSLFGAGPAIAARILAEIRAEVGLSASAGVATSKFVAKVASDLKKPAALVVVAPGEEARFLGPLPVERMWGIGPKAAESLRRAGLRTLSDLASATPARLAELVGSSWGPAIRDLARGMDPREVVPDREPVSIGAEETFETDLRSVEELERALLGQAARVAKRLCASRKVARTVVLKVKLADFTLLTRRITLPEAVADTTSIHRAACALLGKLQRPGLGVRLTGITATGLVAEHEEPRTLFPDRAADRRRKLEKTLLDVRARYGDASVHQAEVAAGPTRDRGVGPTLPGGRIPS